MDREQICRLFLCFALYSFLGWCCECLYCFACDKKWVNRGFLNGPVCPIYGFGATIVVVLLAPFRHRLPLLFLAGMALTSALEYFTSWLMEKLFRTRWWDYSTYPCNIRGRVCLRNSLLFGLLSVVAMELVNPPIARLAGRLQGGWLYAASAGVAALFALDLAATLRAMLELNGKLEQLERLAAELGRQEERRVQLRRQQLQQRLEQQKEQRKARAETAAREIETAVDRLRQRRQQLAAKNRRVQGRLLAAFPRMRPQGREQGLEQLRAALEELRRQRKNH